MALLAAAILPRLGAFRLHGWIQSAIVAATAALLGRLMVPGLLRSLRQARPLNRVMVVHAIAGGAAEVLALYVVVSAGLGWVPRRVRIVNYKRWMRLTLGLWLLAFCLGAGTYLSLNGG